MQRYVSRTVAPKTDGNQAIQKTNSRQLSSGGTNSPELASPARSQLRGNKVKKPARAKMREVERQEKNRKAINSYSPIHQSKKHLASESKSKITVMGVIEPGKSPRNDIILTQDDLEYDKQFE